MIERDDRHVVVALVPHGHWIADPPDAACSAAAPRNCCFWTLPAELSGRASTVHTWRGTLKLASRSLQKAISSSCAQRVPGASTTYAAGTSPNRSSGTPTT